MIATAKRRREKKLLTIKNANKTGMAEVAKVMSGIDHGNKYNQVINNANIDVARNQRPTSIKKYQKYTSQIKDKVDQLYKVWIPILTTFVKHFQKTYNNKKITNNIMIKCKIDLE